MWLMKVDGKGKKAREVLVFDDIMNLLTQHHEDMKRAGTAYNAGNTLLRKLRIPNAAASATALPPLQTRRRMQTRPSPSPGRLSCRTPVRLTCPVTLQGSTQPSSRGSAH